MIIISSTLLSTEKIMFLVSALAMTEQRFNNPEGLNACLYSNRRLNCENLSLEVGIGDWGLGIGDNIACV